MKKENRATVGSEMSISMDIKKNGLRGFGCLWRSNDESSRFPSATETPSGTTNPSCLTSVSFTGEFPDPMTAAFFRVQLALRTDKIKVLYHVTDWAL